MRILYFGQEGRNCFRDELDVFIKGGGKLQRLRHLLESKEGLGLFVLHLPDLSEASLADHVVVVEHVLLGD